MSDDVTARAIHLAAGEGRRLRPITNDRPKPLVELDGVSLLERNVETLRDCGVTDQIVVTGYCADQIQELGYDTEHNPVYDKTDMVYSLFCAQDMFPEDRDLLISYGDIIYEQKVVEALLESDAGVSVIVDRQWKDLWDARFEDPLEDAETLRLRENNRIKDIGNTPDTSSEIQGQYIGLIKIRADQIGPFAEKYNQLAEKDGAEYASVEMTHFIQRMIDDGWDVRAVPVDGGWLEIDTVEDLEMYQNLYSDGELNRYIDLGSTEETAE
ncbi:NTP transferase domain-containing protein [Natronomonas gomsonensis]|uniref:phosphocholine cytidylyltransferase family protein n=1 Tax=Natronomonas gomsonensis TaxID=1046043 RepID=UPI0015BEDB67|nr:phosphocholine cytidylyltransferase family protein [Natronomonas gomsonensis]